MGGGVEGEVEGGVEEAVGVGVEAGVGHLSPSLLHRDLDLPLDPDPDPDLSRDLDPDPSPDPTPFTPTKPASCRRFAASLRLQPTTVRALASCFRRGHRPLLLPAG